MSEKSWNTAPFRPGAAPFEMYNEAGVVHCFDEANRKALKKTWLGRDQSGGSERMLANLAKKRLFAEFRVPRDSPTFGFVAVGEPPTPEELGEGTWLPPQSAEISLPSGLLRMETAPSFSLWPEIPQYDGTFVEVPAGDYRLTFVVADSAPPDQPRIFLTLLPQTDSIDPVEVKTRPAPPPLPKYSKLGKYTAEEGQFTGWHRGGITNLDQRAAERMGLRFGEKLRFESKSGSQEAWFLGRFGNWSNNLTDADFLAVSNGGAGHRNDLFAGWTGDPDITNWLVLSIFRFVAAAEYPQPEPPPFFGLEQKQRKEQGLPPLEHPKLSLQQLADLADEFPLRDAPASTDAEPLAIKVLPERFPLGAAARDDWSLKGGTLHARVLTCSLKVITLNVGPTELLKLGTTDGEFELEIGGQVRRVVLLSRKERERPGDAAGNYRCAHYSTHDELPQWLVGLKASRNLPDDLVSPLTPDSALHVHAARFVDWNGGELIKMAGRHAKTFREAASHCETLILSPPPLPDPPILCAMRIPHWADPKWEILWLESGTYRRDYSRKTMMWDLVAPHGLASPAGAAVALRLSPTS